MSKYMSLSNKECMTQPSLINLRPIEYNQNINANVNISLIVENVTWIKIGIIISVSVSVKIQRNISTEKVTFAVLQNVAAKMVNMQEVLVIQ